MKDFPFCTIKADLTLVTGGLYFLYKGKELVYIGKSTNPMARIGQHVQDKDKDFDAAYVRPLNNFLPNVENYLIALHKPKFNRRVNPVELLRQDYATLNSLGYSLAID